MQGLKYEKVSRVKQWKSTFLLLREKCPNTEFFSSYFPVYGLNTGKYGPDKTPYLDTQCSAFKVGQIFFT